MLSKLKNLWKSDGQESIITPNNYDAEFELIYKDLIIGTLSLHKGVWSFLYSEEFKKQDRVKPLLDFPDVNKVYSSDELHPFFAHRIPGLGQPKVQKVLKNEQIDEHNEAKLLERFGKVSITNPFLLHLV
ncbi:MAG: HipA N-terminal domain-containing protein [Saprospirales bacterium]|jgi:HipA-like protein|nr:HipA N-terminal domain-containing protein [Saprospirales bacterium]MBK6901443.1 HipA N-terminal domain-containing protein [Saprospirales bacterium]